MTLTFREAAAKAAGDFYGDDLVGRDFVPDGGYLKINPNPYREGNNVGVKSVSTVGPGWPAPILMVAADLVTDMYGPHATLIGYIVREVDGGYAVVWQDM